MIQTQEQSETGQFLYYDYKDGYDPNAGGFGFGFRVFYQYNAADLVTHISFDWLDVGTTDSWTQANQDEYTYDANDRLLEDVHSSFNLISGQWVFEFKRHHFNTGCFFNAAEEATAGSILCGHPNPLRPGLPIQCPASLGNAPAQLELYSMDGTKVLQQPFHEGSGIDQSIPNGLYLLVVRGEHGQLHRSKVVWQE